ncbi:MAG: transcriptional regulator GcvA [Kiloniellales bacterium]|nr:transcriptional regulator GcvA [Kiloniellales bacterium]
MARKLPPLNAIKAFESAGRHLSFSKAAAELSVTPAAVSHQIKLLEEMLGVRLFYRLTRAIKLTQAAERILPLLTQSFDKMADAVEMLKEAEESGELRVSTPTTFAARWLVPRLHRFQVDNPGIKVRIDAVNDPVDLLSGEADLAIRYGCGQYEGLLSEALISGDRIAPLCSPRLLNDKHPLKKPQDLRHYTLLHLEVEHLKYSWPTWEMWLKASGCEGDFANAGPVFAQHDVAINAAIAGQGVVLASLLFLESEMKEGLLIQPFQLALPIEFGYWVVGTGESLTRPKVQRFRSWLHEEVNQQLKTTR